MQNSEESYVKEQIAQSAVLDCAQLLCGKIKKTRQEDQ